MIFSSGQHGFQPELIGRQVYVWRLHGYQTYLLQFFDIALYDIGNIAQAFCNGGNRTGMLCDYEKQSLLC